MGKAASTPCTLYFFSGPFDGGTGIAKGGLTIDGGEAVVTNNDDLELLGSGKIYAPTNDAPTLTVSNFALNGGGIFYTNYSGGKVDAHGSYQLICGGTSVGAQNAATLSINVTNTTGSGHQYQLVDNGAITNSVSAEYFFGCCNLNGYFKVSTNITGSASSGNVPTRLLLSTRTDYGTI